MLQVLLLASCATAFVAPGRSHSIGRVAPSHAIDASTLSDSMLALARVAPPHAFDASTVSTLSDVSMTLDGSSLALASFQDLRDSIADVVRPFAILAAVPAFGIALIPVTLAAALARAAFGKLRAARRKQKQKFTGAAEHDWQPEFFELALERAPLGDDDRAEEEPLPGAVASSEWAVQAVLP